MNGIAKTDLIGRLASQRNEVMKMVWRRDADAEEVFCRANCVCSENRFRWKYRWRSGDALGIDGFITPDGARDFFEQINDDRFI